ncbi:MAG: HEAT repeat domain-containing protein [Armatimonadota bacterium]|nr:HEAT repeat domain-containing protein [Armatimonadota bacterium]
MPRQAFKPDASFFQKIAIGAVGTRYVSNDLAKFGHNLVELERGSADTKIWKEVKRKRVRIPDLVCTRCGLRVESRAKTDNVLAMSHSPGEAERAWDYGMVGDDMVAFPVCQTTVEDYTSIGRLSMSSSYWRERRWLRWNEPHYINYFTVRAFRETLHDRTSTKGVTEGTETSIEWRALFASRPGIVDCVSDSRIRICFDGGGSYTWGNKYQLPVVVAPGEHVEQGQVIACAVQPIKGEELTCSDSLGSDKLAGLIGSRRMTERFTGVKLVRLRRDSRFCSQISCLAADQDEDIYVRLESIAYLVSECGHDLRELLLPYLQRSDPQLQLEAIITLAEIPIPAAILLLADILSTQDVPFFLRSAAAWSLGRSGTREAAGHLMSAFSDVSLAVRQEALAGVTALGTGAIPVLLCGVSDANPDIAAGCAEALRQLGHLPGDTIARLVAGAISGDERTWMTWLLGNIPRHYVVSEIARYEGSRPDLHYALSVLWSFLESWIACNWDIQIGADVPCVEIAP